MLAMVTVSWSMCWGRKGNCDTSISGRLYPVSLITAPNPSFLGELGPQNVTEQETSQNSVKAESY